MSSARPEPWRRPSASPLLTARLCALAGLALATLLATALVPQMAPLGAAQARWLQGLWAGAAVLAGLAWLRTARHLGGLGAAGASDSAGRRAAHDFPFRLTRACFGVAIGSGLATFGWVWWTLRDPDAAVVAGVLTYLLLVLPAPLAYLVTRRALRPWAAGRPGAPAVAGVRQSVALRLAFAVQLPVVVCSVGMVLIEQSTGTRYDRDLEDDYRQTYVKLAHRLEHLLPPEAAAALAQAPTPPGVVRQAEAWVARPAATHHQRPLDLRLPPLFLLGAVALLAALLGRWLAGEVTRDVTVIQQALAEAGAGDLDSSALRAASPGALGLRETASLFGAFDAALEGLHQQQVALVAATLRRREAEQAKNRFLTHLSHELKSPLNSILGFTELLLAEVEGPLTPQQRRPLAILWRAGDSLLRFILALLDLARLEVPLLADGRPDARSSGAESHRTTGPEDQRPTGLEPKRASLADLVTALRDQLRPDPTGALEVALECAHPDANVTFDSTHTARALMLLAGLLTDLLDAGEVVVRLDATEAEVRCTVAVRQGQPDATAQARLLQHIDPAHHGGPAFDPTADRTTGERPLPGAERASPAEAPIAGTGPDRTAAALSGPLPGLGPAPTPAPMPAHAFGAPAAVWRLARWVFESQGGGLVAEAGVFLAWLPRDRA